MVIEEVTDDMVVLTVDIPQDGEVTEDGKKKKA